MSALCFPSASSAASIASSLSQAREAADMMLMHIKDQVMQTIERCEISQEAHIDAIISSVNKAQLGYLLMKFGLMQASAGVSISSHLQAEGAPVESSLIGRAVEKYSFSPEKADKVMAKACAQLDEVNNALREILKEKIKIQEAYSRLLVTVSSPMLLVTVSSPMVKRLLPTPAVDTLTRKIRERLDLKKSQNAAAYLRWTNLFIQTLDSSTHSMQTFTRKAESKSENKIKIDQDRTCSYCHISNLTILTIPGGSVERIKICTCGAFYCSTECQEADRRTHSITCPANSKKENKS